MVCPKCVAAGTAGAGLGVSIYSYFTTNQNKYITPVIEKIGITGTAFLFGGISFLASATTMSLLGKLGFDKFKGYFSANCHDNSKLVSNSAIYTPFYAKSYTEDDSFFSNLEKIDSANFMEDKPGNNLLVALPSGSKIFSKQGLNYMVGNEGKDGFFFSMCSTRVSEDGKTSVIDNFEDGKDKIYLFCTKVKVSSQQLSLAYDEIHNSTLLRIDDPAGEIAISILGEHNNLLDDIVLNEKWLDHVNKPLDEFYS